MIKNTLKNFFKNSYYIFLTMGIVYLFILLTAYAFLKSFISDAGTLINSLATLIGDSVNESGASVTEFLNYSINKITWNGDFFETVRMIIDTRWVQDTIKGFFDTLNASGQDFSGQLQVIIDTFVSSVVTSVIVAAISLVVGIIAANYITRMAVRHKSAKRNLKSKFIGAFVSPLFHAIMDIGMIVLVVVIGKYALLVFLGIIALQGFMSLTSSWIIYRDKDLPFKKVVNDKNILKHLGGVFLVALFVLIFAVIMFFINVPLAVLILLPVIIYAVNIIDVSTDSYVLSLTNKDEFGRANPPTDPAIYRSQNP